MTKIWRPKPSFRDHACQRCGHPLKAGTLCRVCRKRTAFPEEVVCIEDLEEIKAPKIVYLCPYCESELIKTDRLNCPKCGRIISTRYGLKKRKL